ncbi:MULTISPECIES: hypothetical protein [Streptomyces]|uniref:Uncharacterized protein n=1 Tax=Streptomyces fimbriatus TaxID=68197 RepID=A0ABW0D2A5_STRFI
MTRRDPKAEVRQLLHELCVDLGFCLPPQERHRPQEEPPADADGPTDAVFEAEGTDPGLDERLRQQVRERADRQVRYSGNRSGTFLTRIIPSTGEVTSYPSPVRAPDGFAVRGRRAVLTRRDHNRRSVELTRAEFDGTTWTVTDRRALDVPGRVVLRCGQGRDGTLWLRAGDTWLRIEA